MLCFASACCSPQLAEKNPQQQFMGVPSACVAAVHSSEAHLQSIPAIAEYDHVQFSEPEISLLCYRNTHIYVTCIPRQMHHTIRMRSTHDMDHCAHCAASVVPTTEHPVPPTPYAICEHHTSRAGCSVFGVFRVICCCYSFPVFQFRGSQELHHASKISSLHVGKRIHYHFHSCLSRVPESPPAFQRL